MNASRRRLPAWTIRPLRYLRHAMRFKDKRGRPAPAAVLVCVIVVFAAVGVTLGPFAWLVAGDAVRDLDGKDQASALEAVRRTILTALGGSAALVAAGFTVRTFYLSRRGQVTDRFHKAISQLASDKLEERLGGVHALEHVMIESELDHAAVVSVLCAFVRAHAPAPVDHRETWPLRPTDDEPVPFGTEPAHDIDAVMTVLARRPDRPEPNRPDLRQATLVGLSLRSYDFEAPPRLTRMFLTACDLRQADLRGAVFHRSILNSVDARGAWLDNADLRWSSWSNTNLRRATLSGARLMGTGLEGSDLRLAQGLTAAQIAEARINEETQLPSELAGDPWVLARLSDCLSLPGDAGPWACPAPTPQAAGPEQ